MTFRLELICDGGLPGRLPDRRGPLRGCANRRRARPVTQARNQTGAAIALAALIAKALVGGWERTALGWLCPYCIAQAPRPGARTALRPPTAPRPLPPPDAGAD